METKIKEYRRKRELTQSQLAEVLGVRQTTICQWENGNRNPSIKMCKKLADVFGVTVDELIGGK